MHCFTYYRKRKIAPSRPFRESTPLPTLARHTLTRWRRLFQKRRRPQRFKPFPIHPRCCGSRGQSALVAGTRFPSAGPFFLFLHSIPTYPSHEGGYRYSCLVSAIHRPRQNTGTRRCFCLHANFAATEKGSGKPLEGTASFASFAHRGDCAGLRKLIWRSVRLWISANHRRKCTEQVREKVP